MVTSETSHRERATICPTGNHFGRHDRPCQASAQITHGPRGEGPPVTLAAAPARAPHARGLQGGVRRRGLCRRRRACREANVDGFIATPPWMHLSIRYSAENGKHVICEKPLTLRYRTATRWLRSLGRVASSCWPATPTASMPLIRAIQTLVTTGQVGRLHAINSWNFNELITVRGRLRIGRNPWAAVQLGAASD